MLAHQLTYEQRTFWRSREAAVFIFIFPLLLYTLLGSVYSDEIEINGVSVPSADLLLAGLFGYGAANTAFGGLAIILVSRREVGILKRLRATPLPPATYIAAVLLSTLVIFALQAVALVLLGKLAFDASAPANWLGFAGAVVLGVACFAGLGVAAASRSALQKASPRWSTWSCCRWRSSGSFGPRRSIPLPQCHRGCPSAHVLPGHRERRLPRRRVPVRGSGGARDRRRVGRRGARDRAPPFQLDAARGEGSDPWGLTPCDSLAVREEREVVQEHRNRRESSGDVRPRRSLEDAVHASGLGRRHDSHVLQLSLRASRGVELDRECHELEEDGERVEGDGDGDELQRPEEDAAEEEEEPDVRRELHHRGDRGAKAKERIRVRMLKRMPDLVRADRSRGDRPAVVYLGER